MDAGYELAKLLKERNNKPPLLPVLGVVEALPELKIRISNKAVLTKSHVYSTVPLYETDTDGNYIWLNKRVYLLPFEMASGAITKYLCIGGDRI